LAPAHGLDRGSESSAVSVEKAGSAVTVDRITTQDVPAICNLYKKVWDSSPAGVPSELVKAWQPTPLEFTSWMSAVTYFAARRDGRLAGVLGCELSHGSCHLVNFAVDPELRRQGVGTALVATALDWAKKANVASVWADALVGLAPANALFPHLGFAPVGVLHHHLFGQDVRLFERVV
jgi:GNAT superfamily N-acetyltransferase